MLVMSFEEGIGSSGRTVFFQVGLCSPLQPKKLATEIFKSKTRVPSELKDIFHFVEKHDNFRSNYKSYCLSWLRDSFVPRSQTA